MIPSRSLVFELTLSVAACAAGSVEAGPSADLRHRAHVRRPVAAALCDDGALLAVANQRSGTVTLIDVHSLTVSGEYRIGERLSAIVPMPDAKGLLVTDEARDELLVVKLSAAGLNVVGRISTPRAPVDVAVSSGKQWIAVACLWSHRVLLLSPEVFTRGPRMSASAARLEEGRSLAGTLNGRVIRLPFAPRMQVFLPGEPARLVVADAFGGHLAVINAATADVESVRELPAHNMRGLSLSADGERLFVAHQSLSPRARTDFDDVHWGGLMQNSIRDLSLASVLDSRAKLLDGSRRIRLGQTGHAAADPAGIAIPSDFGPSRVDAGPLIVALSGVNEVLTITAITERHAVGARPLEVVWDEARQRAYIVCSLDDSVSVLDRLAAPSVTRIALGPRPTPTPRDRGERLFYDGRRSHDGWMSCHSCHTDGHTSGGRADTLSDGSFGTPKQIPSLLGTRDANPWAWNGQFRELHAQVSSSFTSTLQGDALRLPQINDVVAFLHALAPPPPVDEGTWTEDQRRTIDRGRELFGELGCRRCHVPPVTYTIDASFDVGFQDEAGLSEFNPPSLRGVSQRRRFLHDGRANSLQAVFSEQGHQLERTLSAEELDALVAFLQSL